jgi:hypothetical protein
MTGVCGLTILAIGRPVDLLLFLGWGDCQSYLSVPPWLRWL